MVKRIVPSLLQKIIDRRNRKKERKYAEFSAKCNAQVKALSIIWQKSDRVGASTAALTAEHASFLETVGKIRTMSRFGIGAENAPEFKRIAKIALTKGITLIDSINETITKNAESLTVV